MDTVSLRAWASAGYPGVAPGDLVNSSKPGHWLTWGIIFFEALRRGQVATWRHTMRAKAGGLLYSQEATQRVDKPWAELVGQVVRVWHNPAYGDEVRANLCEEEELRAGLPYDAPGIVGQVVRVLPWVGDWLADRVQLPFANFCSEGRAEIEQKFNPAFCAGRAQVSPEDIDAWCRAAGWREWTFRLGE